MTPTKTLLDYKPYKPSGYPQLRDGLPTYLTDELNGISQAITLLTIDRGFLNVRDFGARGDGVVDDTKAFQNALTAASQPINGANAGCVIVPQGGVYRIGSITLPAGVALIGPYKKVDGASATAIAAMGGLRLLEGATITAGGAGVAIIGLPIIKDGMTFPQTKAQADAWTGTAITGSAFSTHVNDCAIIGFQTGIVGTKGHQYYNDLIIDCRNGIDSSDSVGDICRFVNVDCEPYAAIGSSTVADNKRDGVGFKLHGETIGTLLQNCFAYGYLTGFQISGGGAAGAGATILLNCHVDHISIASNSENPIGFQIDGTTSDTFIIGCRAWAVDIGLYLNNSDSTNVTVVNDFEVRVLKTKGVRIDAGNIDITGGQFVNVPTAISINNANSVWSVDRVRFRSSVTSKIIELATNNVHGKFGRGNVVEAGFAGTVYPSGAGGTMPTVASAATLVLDDQWDQMFVSGNTGITTIDSTRSLPGRVVSLTYTGTPVLTHGSGVNLAGSVNLTPTAGSTLTYVFTGNTTWRELSRAIA